MRRILTGVLALAVAGGVTLAGCGRSGGGGGDDNSPNGGNSAAATSADFGTLQNVCHGGTPGSGSGTGLTGSEIHLGVLTDEGFTKITEYPDAAKVFTSWCNDHGGINGRKVVADILDTNMLQVPQQMTKACSQDFALVGGSAALDGLGETTRLSCTLPDIAPQVVMSNAIGSDLQVLVSGAAVGYSFYGPYWSWLAKQKYPDSAAHLGIISGDSPVTASITGKARETLAGIGGKVVYDDLYPAAGVSDWTSYAQKIKSQGVKGLVFNGQYNQLAVLEQDLANINYKLDWIDANSNAYNQQFIQLGGAALASQNNYADLQGVEPLEDAANNPASQQLINLYNKYAPGAKPTLAGVRAFSSWLLFAESASSCSDLTRLCLFQTAEKQTAWTGGGLQAPVDLSSTTIPEKCWNVVQATPQGWKDADFGATDGAYRCDGDTNAYKLKNPAAYGLPTTLADVKKTMADVH